MGFANCLNQAVFTLDHSAAGVLDGRELGRWKSINVEYNAERRETMGVGDGGFAAESRSGGGGT